MNIFVETNGPYVYRSIFRRIPRLREQQQPVHEEHAGTDRCHACGAPIDIQGYSAYTPAEPEFEPELHSDPHSEPEPEPEPDPPSESGPQQPELEPQQQQQQQYTAEAIAELDAKTFVPVARVLEIFQFLFKTVDDALIRQPILLSHISTAFAEGLATLAGPGPQP